MKQLIKYIILSLVISSCTQGYLVTTNFHDLAGFEENSYVYSLPKTRVLVEITADKSTFIPGPYHQYAKKYLGIEGAGSISADNYKITDIKFKTQLIPDPDYTYSIRSENYTDVEALLNTYRAQGLIMKEIDFLYQNNNIDELEGSDGVAFTDLSIRPFVVVEKSKDYNKVSLLEKQVGAKTLEAKAKEAANFLFKIRKRRFKLLAGQYEVFPEGVALETSVKELDELEEEYLSLFIGKTSTVTVSRTYSVMPNESEEMQRFSLLRFSEDTGFHSATGRSGEAIVLQLTDLNTYETLAQYNGVLPADNAGKIFCRLAHQANAKLFYGSHEVLEAELPIFQFGVLVPKDVMRK